MPDSKLKKVHYNIILYALSQPVYRLLFISFLLVSIIPIGLLGYDLRKAAKDNANRELAEKHQLLAENLASPISIHINSNRSLLKLLSISLKNHSLNSETKIERTFKNTLLHVQSFRSLSLVSLKGNLRGYYHNNMRNNYPLNAFKRHPLFINSRDTSQSLISGIMPSPFTGEPTILISQTVTNAKGVVIAIMIGELKIEPIELIRSKIRFGINGHSAIVDKQGLVIAHPNPEWMAEMRDLSDLSVVKLMRAGQTGVTEFYSPFVKENMVAGYTSVKQLGWGIMVPQPKSEVDAQISLLLDRYIAWGATGLMLAILFALPLVAWITRPINRLADAAKHLSESDMDSDLLNSPSYAPREISLLTKSIQHLMYGLKSSHLTVKDLNKSLQSRVDEATRQLRDTNMQLAILAKEDHLTTLANRRHFEETLRTAMRSAPDESNNFCLMLIDIDNFKNINDSYGHAAGDAVLQHIANLLKTIMRPGDIAARFGGDEFVAQLNCPAEIGNSRANDIRRAIAQSGVHWQNSKIQVTASIGILHWRSSQCQDIDKILRMADEAMYDAKHSGRNCVVERTCEA